MQFLKEKGCPVHNCLITRSPSYHSHIKDFDMVLFVGEDNVIKYFKQVEGTRTPAQIYAMILAEPPHIAPNLEYYSNKINWTLSYRSDADVKWVYGGVFDKKTKKEVAWEDMWVRFDNNDVSPYVMNSDLPSIVEGKTKMVAWFVSNCDRVQSKRMSLAREIGQYIPVDIYGDCGDLQCDKGNKQCDDILDQDYKFYLSFENALCKDYMTEKAYQIMARSIIPVVFNGADVYKLLPPKSYINAEDFDTPKQLAGYLLYLANNPKEYLKYFWWKEHYYTGVMHYSCYLCQKLNERDPKKEIAPYMDLQTWYKEDVCRRPRIKINLLDEDV